MIAALLTIVLSGYFYTAKNSRKSIEYAGGAEYVVRITPEDNASPDEAKRMATEVADEIYERVNSLGIKSLKAEPEITSNGASVRVTYSDVSSKAQRLAIEELITRKPNLVFTDAFGNPLFDEFGHFRKAELPNGTSSLVPSSRRFYERQGNTPIKHSIVPLSNKGATGVYVNGENKVQLNLLPDRGMEWADATRYVSTLTGGNNRIVAWLDLAKYVEKFKADFPDVWAESKGNPVLAAHVDGNLKNILRKNVIDAGKYLISDASVKKVIADTQFVIEGHFTAMQAKALAKKINYGSSHYSLDKVYSNYVIATYGKDAFHKAMIAGMVVFALIAVFLIVNYGLLGALSTISIALYVAITLAIFTVMKGEYSPEAIAALIIGIGMAVDANIITYERLKAEVYSGSTLQKSYKDANRKSFSTIFDANITTMIVAFVLFFFGTRNIVGLSVTLILSIALTLVVMLGFTRFAATLLVKTGVFDKKQHLLGVHKKFDTKVQKTINKFDYVKSSKWFILGSAIIFGIALTVMGITAGIAGDIKGGFNLSQDFNGGSVIQISHATRSLTESDIANIRNEMTNLGIPLDNFSNVFGDPDATGVKPISSVKIMIDEGVDPRVLTTLTDTLKTTYGMETYVANTTSDVANSLLRDAMISIAVAVAGIIIYTLIRFKWTYSIAAIIALVHDGLMVTGLFIICRAEISPVFIAGLLSIIGYSINDTIVTFDRIREKVKENKDALTKEKIKEIANVSIKETLKRSILTSITTIIAVLVLMSFNGATKLEFNLAMLFGLVTGTYSSIFIATFFWTKFEMFRETRRLSRKEKSFWTIPGVEEQTFAGINDFRE